jgi:spermidine/putrescine transport system substrate-binding protein
MPHPKERSSLSRREFLQRAAIAGVAVPSLSAILAACSDSSSDTASGGGSGSGSPYVLGSPDQPITLPTFDEIQPIADGQQMEDGPLEVFNWDDYIYRKVINQFQDEFGVEVKFTQFAGMSEAMSKVQNGTVTWDVFFPTIENVAKLANAKFIQPWNKSYVPNLEANIWPFFSDPWYDQGAVYTLPYLTWKTGIGYRRDHVSKEPGEYDMPFDIFWDQQYKGKVGLLDEYRETIGMGLLRNGGTNFNSLDQAEIDAATDSLLELIDLVNVEVGPGDYQKLAEGQSYVRYSWSGNMNYAQWYLPKGVSTDVLGYYYPPDGGWEVANDTVVLNKDSQNPVLAHTFLNFLLEKDVALTNFGYEGFQPPLVGVDQDEFLKAGYIPKGLENTLVTEDDFAQGQPVLPLTAAQDQLYQEAWSKFKAGT